MDIKTANRLYELRKQKGYSQDELASLLNVSRQAVSKWERSESSPDTDNLIALAKLYGMSIDELLDYVPANASQQDEETFERDSQEDENRQSDATEQETAQNDKKSKGVHINLPFLHINVGDGNFGGIHVDDGNDSVHIDDTGIHIQDGDDSVHIGDGGIRLQDDDATVHIGNGGIHVHSHDGKKIHCTSLWDEWKTNPKNAIPRLLTDITFLLSLVAYLLMGFLADLWHPGWIIFFAPTFVDNLAKCIVNKRLHSFPIVSLALSAFLLMGLLANLWHPGWVVMFAIPIYHIVAEPIQHVIDKHYGKDENVVDGISVDVDDND